MTNKNEHLKGEWQNLSGLWQWQQALAVATGPGAVPEMEFADQPNGECDLLESRTAASVHGATIHCADNAERSCDSPDHSTGGVYT